MAFLNSYSFGLVDGYNEIPEKILRLFNLKDFDKTDCTCEVITAGMRGKINFEKPFNLIGYDIAIHTNQKLKQQENTKREISAEQLAEYLDDSERGNSSNTDAYDYASYSMFKDLEDEYDKLGDKDELRDAVAQIRGLRSSIISEYGFDVVIAIRQALNYIPESLALLKRLCEEKSAIAEYIQIILGSDYSFNELFALD